jgi:hypothetical protein
MKELSFEQMESLNGGLSWGCAIATVGLVATFAAIAVAASPVTAVALTLEATAWIATAGGFAYGCAQELGYV